MTNWCVCVCACCAASVSNSDNVKTKMEKQKVEREKAALKAKLEQAGVSQTARLEGLLMSIPNINLGMNKHADPL